MDQSSFDDLTRAVSATRTRRTLAALLGATAVAPVVGSLIGDLAPDDAGAAKKANQNRKPRKYKKKRKLCLNGQQVKSRRKRRIRRWLRQGATRGACPSGCGTCPAGTICVNGVCTPCTVTCAGDAATCGTALQNALTAGGSVYACPGTYGGNFTTGSVALYGAGSGTDPASSTILDGLNAGGVLTVTDNATVSLTSLRLTKGTVAPGAGGGAIFAGAGTQVTVANCALVGNAAPTKSGGGAIYIEGGALTMQNSQVTGNSADNAGGIRLLNAAASSITNSTITGNSAEVGGGGLLLATVTLTVSGTQISNNTAGSNGGGVFLDASSTLTFDSASEVRNNTAVTSGGGIYNGWPSNVVNLNGVAISGNSPDQCSGVPGC